MSVGRRRVLRGGLAILLIAVIIPSVWLGAKWNRALQNVDSMVVPTMVLPTSAPSGQPAAPAQADSHEQAAAPAPAATPVPEFAGVTNILLVGSDARPGEDVSRTDTLVWVHLDTVSNRVAMMSFPRDLWVELPGYGKNRINTAYLTGENKIGKGYGPALLKATVGKLVDQPIDRFVMINFQGFKAIVDRIGGIYVDVPKALDDPAYPTDDYQTIKVHFDAGRQYMDGAQALIYARTRHADSDFGRNQRQQQVLMAIFEQLRAQGLLSQLTSLDDYTDVLSKYIRTDIARGEMLGLASVGARLQSEDFQRFAIDAKMVEARTQPAYVLLLKDQKALRRLVSQMIDPSVASAGGEEPPR